MSTQTEEATSPLLDGSARALLDLLAAGTAAPAAGSACALTAAVAAALTAMVARVTVKTAGRAELQSRCREIAAAAEALRASLQAGVDADVQAFSAVLRLRRTVGDEGSEAVREAWRGAIEVPLSVAGESLAVHALAAELAARGHRPARSDAGAATALALAAAEGALLLVDANLKRVGEQGWAADLCQGAAELAARLAALRAESGSSRT